MFEELKRAIGPGYRWSVRTMSPLQADYDTAAQQALTRPRCKPMEYLPLFLLLMAVLIAAYFYLQRAKSRGTTTTVEHHQTDAPAAPPADHEDQTSRDT